ncbi:MAG: hypothetical protein ACREVM_06825, partial [Burkholderiales bacterium]
MDWTLIGQVVRAAVTFILQTWYLRAIVGGVAGALVGGTISGYLHAVQKQTFDGFWGAFASGALMGFVQGALIGIAFGNPLALAILMSVFFGISLY